jgi:hypothetical protein
MEAISSSETSVITRLHGATSQKTAIFKHSDVLAYFDHINISVKLVYTKLYSVWQFAGCNFNRVSFRVHLESNRSPRCVAGQVPLPVSDRGYECLYIETFMDE